ncbi:MAG TPA: extracellular solute-binding protein [Solirubrobacter sp.]|nr:extracellular solute-binding protein [Solirubrobacter sp.]
MKRLVLVAALSVALPMAVTACGGSDSDEIGATAKQQKKDPVTLVVYSRVPDGGALIQKVLGPIMEEKYNTKLVTQDMLNAAAYAKAVAEKNNPKASVVVTEIFDAMRGAEQGMWAKLDPSIVTNIDGLMPSAKKAVSDTYAPLLASDMVMAYRTDVFKDHGFPEPTGFNDLTRTEYKGKVGLTGSASTLSLYQLIMFAKMNGGSENDIEPGFKFAKQLVDSGQVGFFADSSSVFNQAMLNKQIWIGTQFGPTARTLQSEGGPVKTIYPQEGIYENFQTVAIPAKAPHQKEAQELVNLLLGPEFQQAQAVEGLVLPVRDDIDVSAVAEMFPPKDATYYVPDFAVVAKNVDAWKKRWETEIEAKH